MADSNATQFRLASLLRYREQIVEARQQELHQREKRLQEEQAALARLQRRLAEMTRAIQACQAERALDCEDLLRRFNHLEAVKQWVEQQTGRVADAEAQVDEQRQRLLAAMQDKQVLEKLKERQMAEFKQEQTRKEGRMLDEIGGVRYHRNQREKAQNER